VDFSQLYDSSRCEQEVADIKKELEELYKKHELEQHRKMGGSSSSSTTQSASSSKETQPAQWLVLFQVNFSPF